MSLKKNNKLNISEMCKAAGVSRLGYYTWVKAIPIRADKDIKDSLDYKLIKKAYDY
ncbi:MAG: hypothetical protein GX368_00605 [Erysipelotrichaceae bacterium]|nr:hypothetical protein [Erysipelotrichaceae bacterium]